MKLQVPLDKVDLIQRCASLLKEGGQPAEALEELADPVNSMSLERAVGLVKRLLR